jgi:hypothetical protein
LQVVVVARGIHEQRIGDGVAARGEPRADAIAHHLREDVVLHGDGGGAIDLHVGSAVVDDDVVADEEVLDGGIVDVDAEPLVSHEGVVEDVDVMHRVGSVASEERHATPFPTAILNIGVVVHEVVEDADVVHRAGSAGLVAVFARHLEALFAVVDDVLVHVDVVGFVVPAIDVHAHAGPRPQIVVIDDRVVVDAAVARTRLDVDALVAAMGDGVARDLEPVGGPQRDGLVVALIPIGRIDGVVEQLDVPVLRHGIDVVRAPVRDVDDDRRGLRAVDGAVLHGDVRAAMQGDAVVRRLVEPEPVDDEVVHLVQIEGAAIRARRGDGEDRTCLG